MAAPIIQLDKLSKTYEMGATQVKALEEVS
jgi:hypothetical protein